MPKAPLTKVIAKECHAFCMRDLHDSLGKNVRILAVYTTASLSNLLYIDVLEIYIMFVCRLVDQTKARNTKYAWAQDGSHLSWAPVLLVKGFYTKGPVLSLLCFAIACWLGLTFSGFNGK